MSHMLRLIFINKFNLTYILKEEEEEEEEEDGEDDESNNKSHLSIYHN
ncbi:hypothetical protein K7X86_00800 [Candidatus Sulcia muelleri]|nr:hypothetical protein [Candidatus Karelsulcia muelleri]